MRKRHENILASYIVLMQEDNVLLSRRFNTGYEDGRYGFVSGHLNEGETFTQAIIRESFEEANINLKTEDLEVRHIMHRKSLDDKRIDVFFTTKRWKGKLKNKELHKCDDLSWFKMNQLPDNIIPYIKYALRNIKDKIFYSEYGW